MTPYYQDSAVTIYHGDCREIVPELPIIDLTVTSPPYNQNIDGFKPSGMHKESSWVDKISNGYFDSIPESEYQQSQIEILNAIYLRTLISGSLFYNHKHRWRDEEILWPIDWIRKSRWRIRQEIIWQRNGSCTMNARMFAPNDERIYWLCRGGHQWNQSCVSFFSVWKMASESSDHACAFPIEYPS